MCYSTVKLSIKHTHKKKKNTLTLGLKPLLFVSEHYHYHTLAHSANYECDKQPPFCCIYLPLINTQHLSQALPWLRSLAAHLSPQRPRLNPSTVHVVSVVNKLALRQVFHQVPRFSCYCYSTSAPHSFIHLSPMSHNDSFTLSPSLHNISKLITPLKNTVKKSMFTEATRSHAHKHTDLNAQRTCSRVE
jgi:hypothetical protein